MDSNNSAETGQARLPKPIPLQVIIEQIPDELTAFNQWVCWRYSWDQDAEKWTKYPLNPRTGNMASSTDPKTWTSFDFAYQRYLDSQSESWRFSGIGLVLTDKNNIVGFDLDHCRDPETGDIEQLARDIVQGLPTYWEISTSGTGLRGFAFGRKPGSRCRSGDFEMYQSSRYLVITGHHLEGTPATIEQVQEGITAVYAQLFPPKNTYATGAHPNGAHLEYDDQIIIDAARRARNGADFIDLFDEGNRQRHLHDDGSQDHSRSDAALMRLLTFFTKHEEQLDRLFRVSALNRPKWEGRADYRQDTIDLAIRSTPDQWSGPAAARNGQPPDERHTSSNSENQKVPSSHRLVLPWSDYTNAVELIEAHGQNLHYCHPEKSWYVWDGKRWLADETAEVMRLATDAIKAMALRIMSMNNPESKTLLAHLKTSLSTSRLKAMVDQASWLPGMPILPKELDQHPRLLNCLNGTLDLQTGELQPHRRDDLLTMITAAEYDPEARSKVWESFLQRILPDESDRRYVQKAAGYSLTGLGTEDVLFFPFGPTKTGKSTLLKGLRATWGDYATTADFETFLTREHVTGAPRADIAGLAGKRLVVSLEVDQGKKLAEALIKWLFGGDYVTARFLYKKEFEFLPTFKLWLASNHRPQVSSDDDAIWERIRQIPFEQTIPKEDRDPGIKAELSDPEQSGAAILAWAVEGCRLWQQEGLSIPKHVEDTTNAYRNEMDPMPDFIEACLVTDDKSRVLNAAMWECYQIWSRKNRDRPKLGRKTFTQRLEQAGIDGIDSGGYRFWLGVRMRYHTTSDQDDSEKTSDDL